MQILVTVLLWVFALVNIVWGLFAIAQPQAAARFLGLQIVEPRGDSEIRGVYGGLVAGLGLLVLWALQQPDPGPVLQAFAIAFAALACGRAIGLLLAKPHAYALIVTALEAATAAFLWLAPAWLEAA